MKIEHLYVDFFKVPHDHLENMEHLLAALNPIEEVWIEKGNNPWVVTSGYRTMVEHVRIYTEKNAKRKKEKMKPVPIPMRSQHLKGNAVDIDDPKQDLKFFIAENLELFEEAGIYFEVFSHSNGYVHMQRVPPTSGKRFFIPF